MSFINDDFMLHGEVAKELYSAVKDLPIIDYHCHLSPKMIAEDYKFKNAYELFLGSDHYKWRQMRSAGIDEKYVTGDAPDYEKFRAFSGIMPYLIGNPIYHWTHLELKRYFDIDETLSEKTCEQIWNRCNECLAKDEYSAKNLIRRSRVEVVCTTDDPSDTLEYHEALSDFECKVLPTFRPDAACEIQKASFIDYMKKIGVSTYGQLRAYIKDRISYFNAHGCRLADHGLGYVPFADVSAASSAFDKRMRGEALSRDEEDGYKTAVITLCAEEYARLGWCMQLHIGAIRNNNTPMFEKIGADTGFDSIGDGEVAQPLSRLLDSLEKIDALPKTILYNLNPKDNYTLAAMIGNFQKSPTPSKIQFGSGWWFNDQRDGMEAQMRALANLGLLSKFVGMLTDSRSFVSYTRHEYFRRILCNLLGKWVEDGEYPRDIDTLKEIACDISYRNAKNYFNF